MLIIDDRDKHDLDYTLTSFGYFDDAVWDISFSGEVRVTLPSFMMEEEIRNELGRIGVPCRHV